MTKVTIPFLRTPYNYDMSEVSDKTGLKCEDPSLAQQHQKNDADINEIVRRFGLTGELPVSTRLAEYGDFTGIGDYHASLNAVHAAQEAFYALPAELRAKFDNDPGKLLDFVNDEANYAKAVEFGLIEPKVSTQPEAVESSNEGDKPE